MPGLFGQPDVYLARAQPLGHPTPVVPMPFWLILSFWPWLLAMPQTNSCAPSWPFQIPVSLVPLPFTLTPRSLTSQHHNSDHDTLDAYCLRFSSTNFLPVDPEGHCLSNTNGHVWVSSFTLNTQKDSFCSLLTGDKATEMLFSFHHRSGLRMLPSV